MTAIHVIGLLFACIFVIYIVYEGWDLPLAILIGAVIICITNGMNIITTINAMLEDIKFLFGIMLLPFLFGSILAKVLIDSRGALSTAVRLLDVLGHNRSETFRRGLAVLITIIIVAALGYCSFSNAFLQGAVAHCHGVCHGNPKKIYGRHVYVRHDRIGPSARQRRQCYVYLRLYAGSIRLLGSAAGRDHFRVCVYRGLYSDPQKH